MYVQVRGTVNHHFPRSDASVEWEMSFCRAQVKFRSDGWWEIC